MIYKQEAYDIVGAAMEVHNTLGAGFTEKIYQEALALEFQCRGIPFKREYPIHGQYKGTRLQTEFVPDFICYDSIIVELKAVKELEDIHRAQAINYGRVADFRLALLLNFGSTSLEYERYII
jgi:GxxExxY protein